MDQLNRVILLAILLFLGMIVLAEAQQSVVTPTTEASVPITGAIDTTLRLVVGKPNQRIYVTAVDIVGGGPGIATVAFLQGTGLDCINGASFIMGASSLTPNQVMSLGTGVGAVWVTSPGLDLCILTQSANTPGSLAYAQF